jgi:hypothetical protein
MFRRLPTAAAFGCAESPIRAEQTHIDIDKVICAACDPLEGQRCALVRKG